MNISVVIPLLNEEESLPELFSWIEKVMTEHQFSYEVIAVDDGSKDDSWKVIQAQSKQNPNIKGIQFQRNYGKSAALQVGFEAAQGDVVITMDADLQDSPDEIPELYKMITVDGYHLVSGWKKKRYDPITKTVPTKLFNAATRYVSGINNLHDFNCGLKAYQKKVVKSIEVYGEMHRYIPVIAKWAGFDKITEKPVQHQERKYGKTKFGLERFVNGFLDLMSITFVGRYGKRPMHIFGTLGVLSFFFGILILIYLTITKTIFGVVGMTNRPIFYLGILTIIVGAQLFVAGFLGELIARNGADRNHYHISDKTNF
ncbi:MAG: glycosyltransferase family 2 protein [Chitinophagales bacterium]|nr:glycosyltransferase family 2 protein [Chitinophagales bacterium]